MQLDRQYSLLFIRMWLWYSIVVMCKNSSWAVLRFFESHVYIYMYVCMYSTVHVKLEDNHACTLAVTCMTYINVPYLVIQETKLK